MTLQPTFTLSPRSMLVRSWPAPQDYACLYIYGGTIMNDLPASPYSFDGQHANDSVFFHWCHAADPSLHYEQSEIRYRASHVSFSCDLSSLGANKQLALVFGFRVFSPARLLVFSDTGQLADISLEVGDEQFLMEIESLAGPVDLHFIHTQLPHSRGGGGEWFFRGITGYVI